MTTARRTARSATLEEARTTARSFTARAVTVDVERRVIDAVVIPYGETARVTDDGGQTFYNETFEAGGAGVADGPVAVFGSHRVTRNGVERGPLVGGATEWTDSPEGLRAALTIMNTPDGNHVLEAARVFGTVPVSAEYDVPRRHAADEHVVRSATEPIAVTGVAVILPPQRPAFSGAAGTARAAGGDTADTEEEGQEGADTEEEEEGTETVRALVETTVRREVARMNIGGARVRGGPASPLARFTTFQDAATAARNAPAAEGAALNVAFRTAWDDWQTRRRTARALVDQVTLDNPGVMPPAWLTEVFGLIDAGRPAIEATGGPRSAGAEGLELNWPYYDGDLTQLVKQQLGEKTDINSVKVSLKKGTANLATYAGGSDISLQLITRSKPSYLATYNEIMATGYALTTEYRFEGDLEDAATTMVFLPLTATAAQWRAFLFSASTGVKRATGLPASVAIVSTDVWEYVGGLPDLYNAQYGTANVAGTSSAAELTINVNGLPIVEGAGLPPGTAIVTNSRAASWVEDGPRFITALDVNALGQDTAIWGLGATAVFAPAGVIKAAAAAGRSSSTKDK